MSQIIPIYIPTFISDQNYNPTRVLPHLYFYNGLIDCETYYIESGSLTTAGVTYQQNKFPYFDNYNVVSGSIAGLNPPVTQYNAGSQHFTGETYQGAACGSPFEIVIIYIILF